MRSEGQSGSSFSKLPSMYQLTRVKVSGNPDTRSQNRVTFRRSISLIGEMGAIRRETVGLSKNELVLKNTKYMLRNGRIRIVPPHFVIIVKWWLYRVSNHRPVKSIAYFQGEIIGTL